MKIDARERVTLNENQVREIILTHLKNEFGFDARGITFHWNEETGRLGAVTVEGEDYELKKAARSA